MLKLKQMQADADKMGLKHFVEGGRFKVEGTRGEVKKLFAAQGCDLVEQSGPTTVSYACYLGSTHTPDTFAAMICSEGPDYAYGYTACNPTAWLGSR